VASPRPVDAHRCWLDFEARDPTFPARDRDLRAVALAQALPKPKPDGEKPHHWVRRGSFRREAVKIAVSASFPQRIVAAACGAVG
jgi:hypothetical protein